MQQIIPHRLWLGHAGEGRDFRSLFDAGIRAVIDLAAEEPPMQPPRDLINCRVPLLDGPDNDPLLLELAVRIAATLFERQIPTLVCCANGMSRAPAILAAALALTQREPPEECLRRIMAHHPADVSPALWNDVTRLLGSLR
jgi:protein-tyrosine phosphatase